MSRSEKMTKQNKEIEYEEPLEEFGFRTINSCKTDWTVKGNCKISIKVEDNCDLVDVVEQCKSTIIGLGYDKEGVEEYFNGNKK
jgi:hypothetical protein